MAAPKQTDPQMKIRLTPELKAHIEAAADENGRSQNAEIISRLAWTFERETPDAPLDLSQRARIEADREIYELRSLLRDLLKEMRSGSQAPTPSDD